MLEPGQSDRGSGMPRDPKYLLQPGLERRIAREARDRLLRPSSEVGLIVARLERSLATRDVFLQLLIRPGPWIIWCPGTPGIWRVENECAGSGWISGGEQRAQRSPFKSAEHDRVVRTNGIEYRADVIPEHLQRRWCTVRHIAARVQAVARPGEVLVTRTVKDLVAGAQIAFVDRGPHALKGVPDEWQLFAVGGG